MATVSPFASFYVDAHVRRGDQRPRHVGAHDVERQVGALERMVAQEQAHIMRAVRADTASLDAWWTCNELLAAAARADHALAEEDERSRAVHRERIAAARSTVERLVPLLPSPPPVRRMSRVETYWDDYLYGGLSHGATDPAGRGTSKASSGTSAATNGGEAPAYGAGVAEEQALDSKSSKAATAPEKASRSGARRAGDGGGGAASEKTAAGGDSGSRGCDANTSKFESASAQSNKGMSSETTLQSEQNMRDALSSELLRMASVLKQNSSAFADALERDRVLVEQAGERLGQNLDMLTRTRGQLGVFSKKARSLGWLTLSSIVVVLVSWVMMFVLIRVT